MVPELTPLQKRRVSLPLGGRITVLTPLEALPEAGFHT